MNTIKFKNAIFIFTMLALFCVSIPNSLLAQDLTLNDKPINDVGDNSLLKMAGPRIGFTVLTVPTIDPFKKTEVNENGEEVDNYLNPFLSQFGWQFEKRFFSTANGTSGLFEFVPLIAGMEQNRFFPSMSTLVGIRSNDGFEVGFGPNLSLSGLSYVFAMGKSIRVGELFFPVNATYSTNQNGGRISLLVGFNAKN